ncbi:hypothetical protein ABEP00_15825 [Heyndrickxia sporothermodurans]|uniref:hypothetical protein n=1 Tax=Heyndrickxia sporothermodurans TaxID=46224 RepID=UPI003D24CF1C
MGYTQKVSKERSKDRLEEEFNQLQRTILKTAIEHREDVLNSSVKSHAGYLLRKHNYGKLMADYNREKKKIDYLRSQL